MSAGVARVLVAPAFGKAPALLCTCCCPTVPLLACRQHPTSWQDVPNIQVCLIFLLLTSLPVPAPLTPPPYLPSPPPPQVSRAMTKRYFGDLDNYAESDIVIIGAGEWLCMIVYL